MEPRGRAPPSIAAKNSKDYWKRTHAVLEKHKLSGNKRKIPGEDHDQAKRRRKADEVAALEMTQSPGLSTAGGIGDDDSIAASVALDDASTNKDNLDNGTDGDKIMQLLKRDTNFDDPQAYHDLGLLYNAVLSFGDGKCKLVNDKWELDGFATSLYHHQVIGVSWMLSRELHPTAPKGGILEDEMGLGKTVQILACMSQNLPSKNARASKTLIIVPKRLLCQWFREVKKHCSNKKMKRVFIYAADRAMINEQWEDYTIM